MSLSVRPASQRRAQVRANLAPLSSPREMLSPAGTALVVLCAGGRHEGPALRGQEQPLAEDAEPGETRTEDLTEEFIWDRPVLAWLLARMEFRAKGDLARDHPREDPRGRGEVRHCHQREGIARRFVRFALPGQPPLSAPAGYATLTSIGASIPESFARSCKASWR